MPFRRRKSFRKFRKGRKRRFARRKRRFARRMNPRPEIKHVTQQATAQVVLADLGFVRRISSIAQGLDNFERIGNTVQPTLLQLNMCWSSSVTTCIRWAIIRLKADHSVHAFVMNQYLELNPSVPDSMSQRKFERRHTYKQITGGNFTMNPSGPDLTHNVRVIKKNLKLKGKVFFKGPLSASSDSTWGQLFFVAISDRPSGLEPHLLLSARLFYVDN